jgi:hypothetical protein
MSKFKRAKKTIRASVLTPEEQGLLDILLGDLSQMDPSRLAEQITSPGLAEALVERLPLTDPRTPKILLALRSLFGQKRVVKAIKKTAFRLRHKGVVLPEEQTAEPPVLRTYKQDQGGVSAYLGPIDGTGSRPVFVSVPQMPAGVDVAVGVVNDEEGIIEFALTRHSKKRTKEIKEIFFGNLPGMVETTPSHAGDVMERAYHSKVSGVSDSTRAYLRFRPWLLENISAGEGAEVYRFLPPETISSDSLTESHLHSLFENAFMSSWIVDLNSLEPLMEEIKKAEESRLFISEGQRLEHIYRIKRDRIPKLFPEARKMRLKYRLEEMAYVFFKSAELNLAHVCLAAASSLAEKESPIRVNPFVEFLMERSLAYYMKSSKKLESSSGRQRQKLIIT